MTTIVEVHLDDESGLRRVGLLRPSYQGGVLASSSFEYDADYARSGYALSPDLPLQRGRLWAPESNTLFGAFADASPDEWGQRIVHSRLISDRSSPGERDISQLLSAADAFELRRSDAARIVASIADVVDTWEDVARGFGIADAEIRAMWPAFDLTQRERARAAAASDPT